MINFNPNNMTCPNRPPERPNGSDVEIKGCPGNTFDIATRSYVMAVIGGHTVDPNAHYCKFKELEDSISAISGTVGEKITALETNVADVKTHIKTVESEVCDVKTDITAATTKISDIEQNVSDIKTEVDGKQDAISFSADFIDEGGSLSLNYGVVSETSDLPVKGKDVFAAIPVITLNTL